MLRVPRILEEIRLLEVPVLDRASLEKLFAVKRWQAIQLLHRFGGFQTGKTFLVDRQALIQQLEVIQAGEAFTYEQRRRQRLAAELERVRKHLQAAAVKIPLRPEASYEVEGLPEAVHLRSGQLTVEFAGAEDLLSKLFELAQTVSNDFERFRTAVEHAEEPVALILGIIDFLTIRFLQTGFPRPPEVPPFSSRSHFVLFITEEGGKCLVYRSREFEVITLDRVFHD